MIIFSRAILARKTGPNLKLYGETLKVYAQVKFLGITFDSQLTFKKHFKDILDHCNTRYDHLRLLANKTWGPKIQIYKPMPLPIFEYVSFFDQYCLRLYYQQNSSAPKTSLFGLPFVYQNTSVLSCSMTPLVFQM